MFAISPPLRPVILGLALLILSACEGSGSPELKIPSAEARSARAKTGASTWCDPTPSLPFGWGDVLSVRRNGLLVLSSAEGEPISSTRIPEAHQQESQHRLVRSGDLVLVLARRRGADVVRARLAFDRWGNPAEIPVESLHKLWGRAKSTWTVRFGERTETALVEPIAGALSPEFARAHPTEELRYLLRLDGFLDGESNREVTFGGDRVRLDRYADGSAHLTGTITLNSVDGGKVPTRWRDDGFAGPFRLSVILTARTEGEGVEAYGIAEGSGITRIGDARPCVDLCSPVGESFCVGPGGNGKSSALGARGAVNYLHRGSIVTTGCLGEHVDGSSFLMELRPVAPR